MDSTARPRYYDRAGRPIDTETWARLFENIAYRKVLRTKLRHTRKIVSTVWLGLDHSFYGNNEPIFFETMVFGGPARNAITGRMHSMSIEMLRSGSESEAIANHAEMVATHRYNRKQRRRHALKQAATQTIARAFMKTFFDAIETGMSRLVADHTQANKRKFDL